ncbi:hypothetical protein ABPG73_004776 [Tetrahymena malaccensis]
MLQEHQINVDIPHQDQENLIYQGTQVRNLSPLSKSEIRFDNRLSMIKSTQSPRKEHLQLEISKLRDQSKKLLEMIDSMGKREIEKNKKIQYQNSIISDLKLRLSQLSSSQIENTPLTQSQYENQQPESGTSEQEKRKQEENEVFLALIEEMKLKQDEIDTLYSKVNQLEEQVKSFQLQQINFEQLQETLKEKDQKIEEIQQKIVQSIQEQIVQEKRVQEPQSVDLTDIKQTIENHDTQVNHLSKIVEDQQLQLRKNTMTIKQLSDSNRTLTIKVKQFEEDKGSGWRSFFNFIKELFIVVIISALFSGLKYYISII